LEVTWRGDAGAAPLFDLDDDTAAATRRLLLRAVSLSGLKSEEKRTYFPVNITQRAIKDKCQPGRPLFMKIS
jgi:hypothetical protein